METNQTLNNVDPSPEINQILPAPTAEVPKKNSKILVLAEIVLLIVVGILGVIWYENYFKKTSEIPENVEITSTTEERLKPSPIPLHPGSETYKVSQSEHTGPAITSVTFDPLDVLKGQTLTVVADITDTENITNVTGLLEMDSSKIDFVLKRETGDLKKGSWKAEIKLTDSVFYIYTLTINASSLNGLNTIKVTPR